ncbi:MAG: hypothetical protein IJD77_04110 [Clostridia bacterium]|nr:hypothetical protein [Clostridia bacterium]
MKESKIHKLFRRVCVAILILGSCMFFVSCKGNEKEKENSPNSTVDSIENGIEFPDVNL